MNCASCEQLAFFSSSGEKPVLAIVWRWVG
jgi:hypothetical protein